MEHRPLPEPHRNWQPEAAGEWIQAVLDVSSDGILVVDGDGSVVACNDKFLQLWRLDRPHPVRYDEVLAFMAAQSVDPAGFVAIADAIDAAGRSGSFDIVQLTDGRVFERVSKVHGPGIAAGRVWSFRDLSAVEAQVAQRTGQLRRSELQFRQLVAGVADYAIYMLDRDGRVASWNPGAERIKGYTAAQIIGQHFSTFYTEEDRASGKPETALATAVREGKYEAEAWRVRRDGTRFWANVVIDAIRDADGSVIGFAKVTRDMTERRAMQEQLHQSQKMEAIGQLTGGVAHDFNNLLTAILGNLDTLSRKLPLDNERLRRAVAQATQGAERAATLTQQLLAFARRQPLNPRPTQINRLVTEMADLVQRALRENVTVENVLSPDLWLAEVDAHQLESALLNLAVNARDAMPQGGRLTIETTNVCVDALQTRHADLAPGEYVLICVSDTGTGMSGEVMQRAFDPFFTTKAIGEGTGLGLSQVFGFVKQSGGHVRLHSEAGRGTTVKIYLPRMQGDALPVDRVPPASAAVGRANETILVVEDDDEVRIYSTETLRELGFAVLEAHDGVSALRVLEHHPEISLLFSDVGLPGMNGRQLVDAARARRPHLRVLFTTGYERNALMHDGRLDAGVELLTKPFSRVQLANRIRAVLDSPIDLQAAPAPDSRPGK